MHPVASALSAALGNAAAGQTDSEPMDWDTDGLNLRSFTNTTSSAAQAIENSCTDPFAQFASALFLHCALLDCVDLSHCASSEKQAHCLCEGLLQAVKGRASKGLPPVGSIVLSGLETEFPDVTHSFKRDLDCIGLLHTIQCSGVSLCI